MGVSRITTVVFRADVASYSQTLYWAGKRRVQNLPSKSVCNQKHPTRKTENNAPIIAMSQKIGYQAGRRIGYQGENRISGTRRQDTLQISSWATVIVLI